MDVVHVCAVGTMLFVVFGLAQDIHPFFDAFSQFRLHAVALLLLALPVLLIARRIFSGLLVIGVAVFALVQTQPFLSGALQAQGAAHSESSALRVVQINLWHRNVFNERIVDVLRAADADVLLLQEVSDRNMPAVEALVASHPNIMICRNRQQPGQTAVLTRLPLNGDGAKFCHPTKSFASMNVMWREQQVTVASLHLSWPWPLSQHRQITEMRDTLTGLQGKTFVIGGDFNANPWTNTVQRVALASGGEIARRMLLSWGPGHPQERERNMRFLSLDQTITSGFTVAERRPLPTVGSDHIPIVTELVLTGR